MASMERGQSSGFSSISSWILDPGPVRSLSAESNTLANRYTYRTLGLGILEFPT